MKQTTPLKTIATSVLVLWCSMGSARSGFEEIERMNREKVGEVNRQPIKPAPRQPKVSKEPRVNDQEQVAPLQKKAKPLGPIIGEAGYSVKFPSGVKVDYVKRFKGIKPTINSTVVVHYDGYFASKDERGEFIPGALFVTTKERGNYKAAEFVLKSVNKCLQQAISDMTIGAYVRVSCPGETVFGTTPPKGVPVNQDWVFDVELVTVK